VTAVHGSRFEEQRRGRYNLANDTPVAEGLNSELVQIDLTPRRAERKPEWLKARAPGGETFHNLKKLARDLHLHTVCESANCPNLGECWNQKSATLHDAGQPVYAGAAAFCAVPKGRPEPIDLDEPRRVPMRWLSLAGARGGDQREPRRRQLGSARAFAEVIREIRAQAAVAASRC